MSLMLIMRDTTAVLDLEKELQKVRERQLRAARDGEPLADSQITADEAQAFEKIKRTYYCLENRLTCMPAGKARAITDQQDFESRPFIGMENSILDVHHRILSVPCVGAAGFDDPSGGTDETAQ